MAEQDLLDRLADAARRYSEARSEMDEVFADCIKCGYHYSEIGAAMGVSRQEVHRRKLRRGLGEKVSRPKLQSKLAKKVWSWKDVPSAD